MFDANKLIKRSVLSTERRNIREKLASRMDYLRLDLNENITELEEGQFSEMMSTIRPTTLTAYPDLSRIYSSFSKAMSIPESNIVLTNGSDMGIKSVFDICIEPGDHIVLHNPYFLMYERYAEFFGAVLDIVPVDDLWLPDLDAMLAKVGPKTKMVVVEDPSGNLGCRSSSEQIDKLACALHKRGVLLVIDEAYLSVETQESKNIGLIEKYGNVIIVRTMSKAYGLAGARLGLLISSNVISRELYKVRSLYEIGGLTANIAEWHLNHPEVLAKYQIKVKEGKRFLEQECKLLGIGFRDSSANFVIMELDPGKHTLAMYDLLKEKGILVGKPYSLPHLYGWVRVTVGEMEHCKKLMQTLRHLRSERTAN